MADILFIVISCVAILGALGLILFSHPMNSALSFIATLISIAAFYALLNLEFIFIIQILVYAGAITTLVVFVIMYINIKEQKLFIGKKELFMLLFSIVCLSPFIILMFSSIELVSPQNSILTDDFSTIRSVGLNIFYKWVLPFELVSILLTASVVSVIITADKKD